MGIFNFEQLPKHIIRKITDKCLEDPDSAFAQIPDFKILRNDFLKKHPKIPTNEIVPDGSSDTERGSPEDIDARLAQLYDDKCTFTYYKGSANKPAGSGNLEQCDSRKSEFSALNSFTDWRKKLSNSYTHTELKILVNGKQYKSIDDFDKSKNTNKGSIHEALFSKFNDNDTLFLKDILLATKNSKLQSFAPRREPIVSIDLMQLRKKFTQTKK